MNNLLAPGPMLNTALVGRDRLVWAPVGGISSPTATPTART